MLTFLVRILNQVAQGARELKVNRLRHGAISYDSPFRLWPIDMDIFMHMNNASYVRVAELARWRVFPKAGFFSKNFRSVLFLVTEQHVTYYKPVLPFREYIVRTTITSSENKWLHYQHVFMEEPKGSDPKAEPKVFAVVDAKAVLKRPNGKTIKIDELAKESNSEFWKDYEAEPQATAN